MKSHLSFAASASLLACAVVVGACNRDATPGKTTTTSAATVGASAGATTPAVTSAPAIDLKGKGTDGYTIAAPVGATVALRKSGSRVNANGYSLDVSAEAGGSAAKRAEGVKAIKSLLTMSDDVARFTFESPDGFIYESKTKKQFGVFRIVEAGGATFSCASGNKLAETADKAAEAYAACATLKKK
jgi:hypothetical protein